MSNLRDYISVPHYTGFTGSGMSAMTLVNEGLGKGQANRLTNTAQGVISLREDFVSKLVRPAPPVNSKSNPTFGHAVGRIGIPFTDSAGKVTTLFSGYDLASHHEMTEAQRLATLYTVMSYLLAPDLLNLHTKLIHA